MVPEPNTHPQIPLPPLAGLQAQLAGLKVFHCPPVVYGYGCGKYGPCPGGGGGVRTSIFPQWQQTSSQRGE